MARAKDPGHYGDLGRAIYMACNRAGISILELANYMGKTASDTESGRGVDLHQVARITGVSVEEIWSWAKTR